MRNASLLILGLPLKNYCTTLLHDTVQIKAVMKMFYNKLKIASLWGLPLKNYGPNKSNYENYLQHNN